jgi:hypothetical protein
MAVNDQVYGALFCLPDSGKDYRAVRRSPAGNSTAFPLQQSAALVLQTKDRRLPQGAVVRTSIPYFRITVDPNRNSSAVR